MQKFDKPILSKTSYAVDLSSLSRTPTGRHDVRAVWFRRKDRKTSACFGTLWDYPRKDIANTLEFLENFTDGRYGGNCIARWDGTTYWGEGEPEAIEHYLGLLKPMLEEYPDAPEGYDGWWRF